MIASWPVLDDLSAKVPPRVPSPGSKAAMTNHPSHCSSPTVLIPPTPVRTDEEMREAYTSWCLLRREGPHPRGPSARQSAAGHQRCFSTKDLT